MAKKRTTKAAGRGSAAARKNPKGGLTAAGRAHFKRTEGANLKPGVTGAADTPEKMRRKGSFLRRHYGKSDIPPLVDGNGEPTRFAKQAHAWGEPVPKTMAAVRKLAQKGAALLERYRKAKERGPKRAPATKPRARSVKRTRAKP